MNHPTRRDFLARTSAAGAALTFGSAIFANDSATNGDATVAANAFTAPNGANRKIVAAVMGTNGRGMQHISGLMALPDVEIAYVCDPDDRALAKAMKSVSEKQQRPAQPVKDFRHALDDPSVDVLCVAAPNHWHAPATILACAAGKHVYVEKPGSHTPEEAKLMVQAARKHRRVVQMGNQRRSFPWVIEAIEKLKAGEIGQVNFARTWYNNARKSIGRGNEVPVPSELDFALWQGPAPERPYVDNLVHYNWHWRWHWGGGELANNGIHSLDLARWGMGLDLPTVVTCAGGKYAMPADDDQETPDTIIATYDFGGGRGITWEGHSCNPRGFEGDGFGVNFYGSDGHVIITARQCITTDLRGKVRYEAQGASVNNSVHFADMFAAIRDDKPANSDVEDAQKSTMLCHLGNIAWRTQSIVRFDPQQHTILDNKPAMKLWTREYRKGWEPLV